MAYTEQQKQDHIRELQGYLHSLSHTQNLPHVSADGFYGVQTADTVREFQKQHQLRPTGEVNSATWNAIAQAHQKELGVPTFAAVVFPTGVQSYAIGASGTEVFLIQALLMAVHTIFRSLPAVTVHGTYDDKTRHAVEQFQALAALPTSGIVDPQTWNHLLAASETSYVPINR